MDNDDVQHKDIGKLWGAIIELKTAMIGIDGTNGIRGEMRAFIQTADARLTDMVSENKRQDAAIDELRQEFHEYTTVTHPATCLGKQALAEYIATEDKRRIGERRTRTEDIRSRRAMYAAILAAFFAAVSPIISTLIGG